MSLGVVAFNHTHNMQVEGDFIGCVCNHSQLHPRGQIEGSSAQYSAMFSISSESASSRPCLLLEEAVDIRHIHLECSAVSMDLESRKADEQQEGATEQQPAVEQPQVWPTEEQPRVEQTQGWPTEQQPAVEQPQAQSTEQQPSVEHPQACPTEQNSGVEQPPALPTEQQPKVKKPRGKRSGQQSKVKNPQETKPTKQQPPVKKPQAKRYGAPPMPIVVQKSNNLPKPGPYPGYCDDAAISVNDVVCIHVCVPA
jgi:hypothetical protein